MKSINQVRITASESRNAEKHGFTLLELVTTLAVAGVLLATRSVKDYEFLVLFTSTVGLESDVKLIRKIKEANPSLKIAFVGPHGHIKPDETLNASADIDFVTRGEFDHSVVEYAHGSR